MSQSFIDTEGREWRLKLDWDLHEQVKDREGVLLLSLGDNNCELLARLHSDFALLVNVIWILCEDQLEQNGIVADAKLSAERKFAKGLGGDVLESAATALVAAVIDFFPSQEQRASLRALVEKATQLSGLLTKTMYEKVVGLNPEQLAKNYIDSVSSLQPSPELSLGGTPSAS